MPNFDKIGIFNHQVLTDELRAAFPGYDNAIGCATISGGLKIIVPDGILESEIDIVIAAHNPNDETTEQAIESDDTSSIDDLLSKAELAITQSGIDRSVVLNSTIPTEIKDVLDNMLKRDIEIIRALAGIIRRKT